MKTLSNFTIRATATAIITGLFVSVSALSSQAEGWIHLGTEKFGNTTMEMYADLDGVTASNGHLAMPAALHIGDLRMTIDLVYNCDTGMLADMDFVRATDAISGKPVDFSSFEREFKTDIMAGATTNLSQSDIDGTKVACKMFGA